MYKSDYNKFFVAADDQRILDAFIMEYGKKVCYYGNVVRAVMRCMLI